MMAIIKSRPVLLTVFIPLIYMGCRPLKKKLKANKQTQRDY